ncbi:9307_t:CDS:2, partial [Racocetra persica]
LEIDLEKRFPNLIVEGKLVPQTTDPLLTEKNDRILADIKNKRQAKQGGGGSGSGNPGSPGTPDGSGDIPDNGNDPTTPTPDKNKNDAPPPSGDEVENRFNNGSAKQQIENNPQLTEDEKQATLKLLKTLIAAEILSEKGEFNQSIFDELLGEKNQQSTAYKTLNENGRVDNVIESLERRGYILKKLVKKATLLAYLLGLSTDQLIEEGLIINELKKEINKTREFIDKSNRELSKNYTPTIAAQDIFFWYDTKGISEELIRFYLEKKGHKFPEEEFSKLLAQQKEKAPLGVQISDKNGVVESEISALSGVVDPVATPFLVMKLKEVRAEAKKKKEGIFCLELSVENKEKTEKKITAGDFQKDKEVKIKNPNLHLATLAAATSEEKKPKLEIKLYFQKNWGYWEEEEQEKNYLADVENVIAFATDYAPVKGDGVSFQIKSVVISRGKTEEELTLMITTNGVAEPKEALQEVLAISQDAFGSISQLLNDNIADAILYEKVETSLPMARSLTKLLAKLIGYAKQNDLHARRLALKYLVNKKKNTDQQGKKLLDKLFSDLKERYKERAGGYSRITKLNYRLGDNNLRESKEQLNSLLKTLMVVMPWFLKDKDYFENTVKKIGFWDNENYFYEAGKNPFNMELSPEESRKKKPANLPQNPFQFTRFTKTSDSQTINRLFSQFSKEELIKKNQEVSIAGRMTGKRMFFADLTDQTGTIQLKFSSKNGDLAKLDNGSIIGVKGIICRTDKGQLSVE